MMKYILTVMIMAFILDETSGATMEQLRKTMKMLRNVCLPKTGAPKEMVENVQNGVFVEDERLKCYMKCCLGMLNAMKGNTYLPDAAIKMAEKLLPSDIFVPYKNAMESCRDAGSDKTDGCDMAYEIIKCNYHADPSVFLFP